MLPAICVAEFSLETERLILRQPVAGDAERQFRLLNTPGIMRYIGGSRTLAEINERHAKIAANFTRYGFGFMMLIEKQSGDLVGHCGLKRVDAVGAKNPGDLEIGWVIREDRWRRGYAGEAVRAILDWAFGPLAAPHVVALTSPANEPSWRLMERLGMERRIDLDFHDPAYPPEDSRTIVYSLSADQWKLA